MVKELELELSGIFSDNFVFIKRGFRCIGWSGSWSLCVLNQDTIWLHNPYDNAFKLRAQSCYSYITAVKHSEKRNNFYSCPFFVFCFSILFCVCNRPLQKAWSSTGNTSLLETPGSPLQPLWWCRRNQWLYKMNSGVFAQQGVMLSGGMDWFWISVVPLVENICRDNLLSVLFQTVFILIKRSCDTSLPK